MQLQGLRDRVLPRIAALDDADRLLEFFLADAGIQPLDFIPARGDDDVRDQRARRDAAQAENDDGHAVELQKLFRRLVRPCACRDLQREELRRCDS